MHKCDRDVESTSHSLLYCPTFTAEWQIFLSIVKDIDQKLLENTDPILNNIHLIGDASLDT